MRLPGRVWEHWLTHGFESAGPGREAGVRYDAGQGNVLGRPRRTVDLSAWPHCQEDWPDADVMGRFKQFWVTFECKNATLTDDMLRERVLSQRLKHLTLTNCALLSDEAAKAIGRECQGRLESIDLSGCSMITDEGVQAMTMQLRGLRCVRFDQCLNTTDFALHQVLTNCPELEVCSFRSNKRIVGNAFLTLPSASQSVMLLVHHSLRELDLAECTNLQDDTLRWIGESLLKLKVLNLSFCTGLSSHGLCHLDKLSRTLSVLNVSGCVSLDDGAADVLTRLGRLQELRINKVRKMSHRTIARLLSKSVFLQVLECDWVSQFRLPQLKGSMLESLSCKGSPELSKMCMARLSCLRRLVSLSVSRCTNLTDDALGVLMTSPAGRSLRHLDISYCANLQSFDWMYHDMATSFLTVDLSGLEFVEDVNLSRIVRAGFTAVLKVCDNDRIRDLNSCCESLRKLDVSSGCPQIRASRIRTLYPDIGEILHDTALEESLASIATRQLFNRFDIEMRAAGCIQACFRRFCKSRWVSFRYILFRFRNLTPIAATHMQRLWRQHRVPHHRELTRRFVKFQRVVKSTMWRSKFWTHMTVFKSRWAGATAMQATFRGYWWRRKHREILELLIMFGFKRQFAPVAKDCVQVAQEEAVYSRSILRASITTLPTRPAEDEMGFLLHPAREAVSLRKAMLVELRQALQERKLRLEREHKEKLLMRKSFFSMMSLRIQTWVRAHLAKKRSAFEQKLGEYHRQLRPSSSVNLRGRSAKCDDVPGWIVQGVVRLQARLRGRLVRDRPAKVRIHLAMKEIPRLVAQLNETFIFQGKQLDKLVALRAELNTFSVLAKHHKGFTSGSMLIKGEFYAMMQASMELRCTVSEQFHTNYAKRMQYHDITAEQMTSELKRLRTLLQKMRKVADRFQGRIRELSQGRHRYDSSEDPKLLALMRQSEKRLESLLPLVITVEQDWAKSNLALMQQLIKQAEETTEEVVRDELKRLQVELETQKEIMELHLGSSECARREWSFRRELLSTQLERDSAVQDSRKLQLMAQESRLQDVLEATQRDATEVGKSFVSLCLKPRSISRLADVDVKYRLERASRRAKREINLEAWTALIPIHYTKPDVVARVQDEIVARKMVVAKMKLGLLEGSEEDSGDQAENAESDGEDLDVEIPEDVAMGNFLQQMIEHSINKASESAASERKDGLQRLKDLLVTERQREYQRIMQAIVQRQQASVGFSEGVSTIVFTVGDREEAAMRRLVRQATMQGNPPFYCVRTNLARAFEIPEPVYMWYQRSLDTRRHVRRMRVEMFDPNEGPERFDKGDSKRDNQGAGGEDDEDDDDHDGDDEQNATREEDTPLKRLILHSKKAIKSMARAVLFPRNTAGDEEEIIEHPKLPGFRLVVSRFGTMEESVAELKVSCREVENETLTRKGFIKLPTEIRKFGSTERHRDEFFLWMIQARDFGKQKVLSMAKLEERKAEYEGILGKNANNKRVLQLLQECELDIEEQKFNAENGAARSAEEAQMESLQTTIDGLGLSKLETRKLTEAFASMDTDLSGSVSLDEFLAFIGLAPSELCTRVFEFLDSSNDGTMDFQEFLQALGTLCLFGNQELVKMGFQFGDREGKGSLFLEDFIKLLTMLHGVDPEDHFDLKRVMTFMHGRFGLGVQISFEEIYAVHLKYPVCFQPIFEIQQAMTTTFMGHKFWNHKKRVFHKAREALRIKVEKEKLKLELERRKQKKLAEMHEHRRDGARGRLSALLMDEDK
ncbi:F-box/LRR-repeat protein 2 (F-box and leucine-rich repeat protein 2) [Durusdinium trenchii]|uniref:F-box/LRR-repeat protein 2 (F-box and leucine-rich repeat protein 2) n=1 Tax=Durusdinium trenchii TaxID=1381693 RepID=A0ABP0HAT9_9DINO